MTLKFDGWAKKIKGHLFHTTSSFLHYFKSISEFKLKILSGNAQLGFWQFFIMCDLEIWWMTFENKWAPLLYYIKLCASFQSHGWIQTGVTVQKWSIQVKIKNVLFRVKFDGWPWKTIAHLFCDASLKNNKASLLSNCKLSASFRDHWWIQTRVTLRKRRSWVKIIDFISCVSLKFDRCPWKIIGHLS